MSDCYEIVYYSLLMAILINFLMFGIRPKIIKLNSNNNNNLVWLKMGKWVTKGSMKTMQVSSMYYCIFVS